MSLNNESMNGTGMSISSQPVRNRLHEFGLNAMRRAMRVQFTRQHVQDWFDFAVIHIRWTIRDWTPVVITDESRFCLDFTDVSWLGESSKRDFINRMWQNMTVVARAQSWFGKALTSTEKLTFMLLKTDIGGIEVLQ